MEYLALSVGIFVIIGASVVSTVAFLGRKSGGLFVLKIVFAVCALAAGIVTIVFKEYSASIICVVFAGALSVDGSLKLSLAIRSKGYTLAVRTVCTVISLITILSSLAMVRFTPYRITDGNIEACSFIIGIIFILDAVSNFIIPFIQRGLNKRIVEKLREDYEAAGLKTPDEQESEKPESLLEANESEIEPSECKDMQEDKYISEYLECEGENPKICYDGDDTEAESELTENKKEDENV